MKTIIGALILVFVMWIINNNIGGTQLEYVKQETMEVVEEPKEAWQTDADAIKAAQDVIRKKELESELKQVDEEIKLKQDRRKEITNELTAY